LFNPNQEHEKADIVKNAYVPVKEHQSHVEPIGRLIRKKIRPAVNQSTEIDNLEKPQEIFDKLSNATNYNNKVLLLIGSVGSGKSTFTTYLKEVALDNALIDNLEWINLDFNDAPVNQEEIYKWVKTKIINKLQSLDQNRDHADLRFIKHLYSEQIADVKKGALSILKSDSDKYQELLVEKIFEFQNDLDLTLDCYVQKIIKDNDKELVIVLDNCDKRNLDEQLLMFEVANWMKDKIKAIIFLPLRDTTFDHFRNQKPLDTVIKDLTFRINPPSLQEVIYSRIKYANRLSEKESDNTYTLPNGFKVKFPAEDELYYLKSILKSLFQNNFFKSLITGLAGRNVRKGIEIFLDFCKSGYISESEILQMKHKKGDYELPSYLISRVFIRGNRKFYSDSDSRIKNLFHSDPAQDVPNPFTRAAILNWLNIKNRDKGPSGIIGFHSVQKLKSELSLLGHSENRIRNEILFLLNNELIISESQNTNQIDDDELISINPPGVIHLNLLTNLDYLASCAENVWYKIEKTAEKIAENMTDRGAYNHLTVQCTILNANLLIHYLKDYFDDHYSVYSDIVNDEDYIEPVNFEAISSKVSKLMANYFDTEYTPFESDSIQRAKVQNVVGYGIFCELVGTNKIGIIFRTDLSNEEFHKLDVGDEIDVVISKFNLDYDKYDLKLKSH